MPQMAPINWLTLYFYFLIIFIFIIILTYYTFLTKPTFHKNNFNKSHLNWKW